MKDSNFIFKGNKWKPEAWDYEKRQDILKDLRYAREMVRLIENDLLKNDFFLQRDYGALTDVVEGLYGKLDIGALAEDNARRNKEFERRADKDD